MLFATYGRACVCIYFFALKHTLTQTSARICFHFNKCVSVFMYACSTICMEYAFCVCVCVCVFVCVIDNAPHHTPFSLFDMCLVIALHMHVTIDLSLYMYLKRNKRHRYNFYHFLSFAF